MPEKTLDAFIDHGEVGRTDVVTEGFAEASKVLDDLELLGIEYNDVTDLLERQGVDKFVNAWEELLAGVATELEKAGE